MSQKHPPVLLLVTMGVPDSSRRAPCMAGDEDSVRCDASHWYVRLREEEGDEAAKAEFACWLCADPAHAQAWSSMCETMETVGRAPAQWRSYTISGQSGLRRRSALPRWRGAQPGKHRIRGAIIIAAVAACAVILAVPAISLHLRADHMTGTGHVTQLRLADGSTAHVGPDSAIAVDYSDNSRSIRLLSGQAMFDVVHDSARPFRVQAGNVTTTVVGTSFDVRMLADMTSVSVARGHVRVEDRRRVSKFAHDLLAGDMVCIDANHVMKTGNVAPQLVGGWRNGEVLAENRTVGSMIEEIRPWFSGRIFVTDAKLLGRRVTGIYDVKNPEQALAMIVQPYGGRITRITPWILVVNGT